MAEIPLRDAIARYAAEDRAPVTSYDLYRRSAKERGTIWIGEREVPAHKIGRSWSVRAEDLELGLESHRAMRAASRQATSDYRRGVLHGRSGDTIYTEVGGYERRDPFHFAWSDYERGLRRSDGTWYCSSCMKPTEAEHENPECHRCSDWGSCGRDCTLSRIYCKTCGTSRAFK